MRPEPAALSKKEPLVLLLHGIRTDAFWHDNFINVLTDLSPNIQVESRKYGKVPVVSYLFPMLRNMKIGWLREVLEALGKNYPTKELSVVAHSLGTYLIAETLKRNPGLRVRRIILCGSVVKREFDWNRLFSNGQIGQVLNDCGTRDIWPIFSRLAVMGTGDSGVFGFHYSGKAVSTRYFEYYSHSSCFNRTHISAYWLPFLLDGTVVLSPDSTPRTSQLTKALIWLRWPIRLSFIALLCALIAIVSGSVGSGNVLRFSSNFFKTDIEMGAYSCRTGDTVFQNCMVYAGPDSQLELSFTGSDLDKDLVDEYRGFITKKADTIVIPIKNTFSAHESGQAEVIESQLVLRLTRSGHLTGSWHFADAPSRPFEMTIVRSK